jgi:hypothetical protein
MIDDYCQINVTRIAKIFVLSLLFSLLLQGAKDLGASLILSKQPSEVQVISIDHLLVYDSLSTQQTMIYRVMFQSSQDELLWLLPIPKQAKVFNISDGLWQKLNQKQRNAKNIQRKLSLAFKSWLFEKWTYQTTHQSIKEKDLQTKGNLDFVIEQELDLHHLLMDKGFYLSLAQMKLVQEIFEKGMYLQVVVLHDVKKLNQQIQTFRSPSIAMTFSIDQPHFWLASEYWLETAKIPQSSKDQVKLKLWTLNETALQIMQSKDQLHTPSSAMMTYQPKSIKLLSPAEVSALNQSLGSNQWSFRRTGLLSAFEFEIQPAVGMKTALGEMDFQTLDQNAFEDQHQYVEYHQLRIYWEFILLALIFLLWLWFDYASEEDHLFRF